MKKMMIGVLILLVCLGVVLYIIPIKKFEIMPTPLPSPTLLPDLFQTIEETVLVDENGILVKAMSLERNDENTPRLNIYIENNTDKDVTVYMAETSINGFMVNSHIITEIPAGEAINDKLEIHKEEWMYLGCEDVGNVEFRFEIWDHDTCEDIIKGKNILIETSKINDIEPVDIPLDEVIFDEDGIKIAIAGFSESYEGETKANLYYENNTDEGIMIKLNGITINDCMMSIINTGQWVRPNKKAIKSIYVSDNMLENSFIKEIEVMDFDVVIFNESNNVLKDIGKVKITNTDATPTEAVPVDGQVIYDADGIKIMYLGYHIECCEIVYNFYFDNNMNEDIQFYMYITKVDGIELNSGRNIMVIDNKNDYYNIRIRNDEVVEIGGSNIKMLEVEFYVRRNEDNQCLFESEPITIEIN